MDSFDIEAVIENLDVIADGDGDYMRELAEKAIKNSAYWYNHPSGGPARAPRHADRMDYGNTGLEIEFGANSFLVEEAIRRCLAALRAAAERALETEEPADETELRARLRLAIRGAVSNYQGEQYAGYYNASDGFMHFGAQAIHVESFLGTIWDDTEAYLLTDGS
jgi:hypothetical protein